MPIADLPPEPPAMAAPLFDLAQMPQDEGVDLRAIKPRCPVGRPGEIVVCATNPEKERMRPLPDTYETAEGLPRAQLGLSENETIGVDLEAATLGGGQVSNRAMVRYKLKF
ncbi:hypothetical protein [Novosphingobium guangzhouense]|uniref:Uncharacterized protein n=1 Tax=Novosphingobium guangzhouense TaxID=1850347 RepID=A0A2K2G0X1_9SPHN|nr:hypothetical protein [Novosphingobium guangzhouense]PNU04686.1 hypothetical protein A8V01_18985 [Novosphingobium guangzhouense]